MRQHTTQKMRRTMIASLATPAKKRRKSKVQDRRRLRMAMPAVRYGLMLEPSRRVVNEFAAVRKS